MTEASDAAAAATALPEGSELKQLFLDGKASQEQADEIFDTFKTEIGGTTCDDYFLYFKDYILKDWVDEVATRKPKWKKSGPMFIAMKNAFNAIGGHPRGGTGREREGGKESRR